MPEITVNGQNVFYTYQKGENTSEKRGPDALLLHGAGGTHLDWPASLRRLSGANVYTLDLPGHGRSGPPGRNRVEEYANVVIRFLKEANLARRILIGHSMGGAIAQEVALRLKQDLTGIVLMGTGARLRVTDAIMRGLLDNPEEALDALMERYWPEEGPASLKELTRRRLREMDLEVLYGDFLACDRFDRMDRVQEIRTPTLVISGTLDTMTPVKYGRYLAKQIPDAQLRIIKGGNHMMALQKPQEVGAYVEAFIAQIKDGRGD